MKIYILGSSGMLGSKLFSEFSKNPKYFVRGSIRDANFRLVCKNLKNKVDSNISAKNIIKIKRVLNTFKPKIIINCIGVVKQKIKSYPVEDIFYINSIFPHELYRISKKINAKLIHFSTDCVFNGIKGGYSEKDKPNAYDVYGLSKSLGEINYRNTVTIRTSIIGHELNSKKGLLEWFLNKKNYCYGYVASYFSGLTTLEVFNFLNFYFSKKFNLNGLIHLSSKKISKFNLLNKIAKIYNKKINIKKNYNFKIDRSLISSISRKSNSYKVPNWDNMIREMYLNNLK